MGRSYPDGMVSDENFRESMRVERPQINYEITDEEVISRSKALIMDLDAFTNELKPNTTSKNTVTRKAALFKRAKALYLINQIKEDVSAIKNNKIDEDKRKQAKDRLIELLSKYMKVKKNRKSIAKFCEENLR